MCELNRIIELVWLKYVYGLAYYLIEYDYKYLAASLSSSRFVNSN